MPVRIPADADLNTLRTPGFFWCDGSTNANRPDDSGSFCLLIEKTGSWAGNGVKQTYTNYDSGIIYTRVSPTKDVWNPWKPLATATKPQEFDLPLASGFTALSGGTKYCKTQENIVIVNIRCKANSSLTPSGDTITIGNLPSGFRPSGFVSAGAVFDTDDLGGKYAGGITVNQNGQVNANQQNNRWQFCYATIIFVAT